MKTATFDKGLKTLHFFDSKDTAINVVCSTITKAKTFLEKCEVEHYKIDVYNKCIFLKTEWL